MTKKQSLCLLLCLALLALLETLLYRHFGDFSLEKKANFCLSTEQAKIVIAEHEDLVIVDVRTPIEFSFNALPGSVNMPLFRLRELASELDSCKPVLIVDLLGIRSTHAYKILRKVRPDLKAVYYLKGNLLDLLPKKPSGPILKKLLS